MNEGTDGFISGGYYLKARRIQEAEIAKAPPHVREIWDWLLKEANHKDAMVDGKTIKRGQCVRSYEDIQKGLEWNIGWRRKRYSNDQCETAMKWLRKAEMVTTQKTTRGMIVTICKYDYYQTPANYENHNEADKKTTRKPQTRHTINKNEKKNTSARNSIEYILAAVLFNCIVKRDHDFKANLDRWATDMDKLVRIDERKPVDIANTILWSQKDSFWRNNVLSAGKLRAQFPQLWLKMNAVTVSSGKREFVY